MSRLPCRSAHNHQRHRTRARSFALQFAKQLPRAIQVTVNNQSINFGFREPGEGSLRFALDSNIHVQAAKNAFQNTDFLPITRNHHRRECHASNFIHPGNLDVDHQRNVDF